MGRLEEKVAIITGGSSGIGESTVRLFVKEGAKVLLFARNEERSNRIVKDLGKNVQFFKGDVTVESDIKDVVDTAVESWGKLDCIFNNAGKGGVSGPIDKISEEGFDDTVGVLLKGVLFGVKHAARVMKPQGFGSIINCSSVAGLLVGSSPVIYSSCKAAVNHLTRMAAGELGEFGIRVNSVCPGAILTRIFSRGADMPEGMKKEISNYFEKAQPIRRTGLPIDIAYAVLWLASDESRFVTGHPLVVDGGISLGLTRDSIQKWRKELGDIRRRYQ